MENPKESVVFFCNLQIAQKSQNIKKSFSALNLICSQSSFVYKTEVPLRETRWAGGRRLGSPFVPVTSKSGAVAFQLQTSHVRSMCGGSGAVTVSSSEAPGAWSNNIADIEYELKWRSFGLQNFSPIVLSPILFFSFLDRFFLFVFDVFIFPSGFWKCILE